ncbi:MAG: disulfide bond formation protein DsbB [Rickettsiales bacterium]|jgi:disulfide bond formation protein DsbB
MKRLANKIDTRFLSLDKLIFLLSFLPLVAAYIIEYLFGLEPCNLCLYQRIPFFIILFLTLFSTFFFSRLKFKNYIVYLIILLFFTNMILALYHVGVEQKFFALPSSCSGVNLLDESNINELTEIIMNKKAVKCDEPDFEFFGITLTTLNALYCLFATTLICLIKTEIVKFKSK